MWLKRLLNKPKILVKDFMKMFYDNEVATTIAKNLVHHDRIKHLERSPFYQEEDRRKVSFISLHSNSSPDNKNPYQDTF